MVHLIHKCNDGSNCCKVSLYLLFRMVELLLFLCLLISALLLCLMLVATLILCLLLLTAMLLEIYKAFLQLNDADANRYHMHNE